MMFDKEVFEKVQRIREIKDILDNNKNLYEELDEIVLDLLSGAVQVGQTLALGSDLFLTVVDNFAEANTIYRAMPSKRFDVKIESQDEFKKRLAKAEKAKGKV